MYDKLFIFFFKKIIIILYYINSYEMNCKLIFNK